MNNDTEVKRRVLLATLVASILFILFIVSVFWPWAVGAAWQPTPMKKVRRMLALAEVKPQDVVYDLGSGDGRIIVTATKEYGAKSVGIEVDPLRFLFSWLRTRVSGLGNRTQVIYGNFFYKDLSAASVVTLFLLESTNDKLRQKFEAELKPGTRVVSYHWTFTGWMPIKVDRESELYLYEMGNWQKCSDAPVYGLSLTI